ncbi:MAG: MBL fold metallo-hydrolase [Pseudoruegeria sp.]
MIQYCEFDFFEVGESGSGDAIAIRYADDYGQVCIHVVDGGYEADGPKIATHIRTHYGNPSRIDNVILTHPDGDHAAGLKTILEEFEIGVLWMNRPWLHLDALLPAFSYQYTPDGLTQRLRKNFPHTAALEAIALRKGIPIYSAFQDTQIDAFTVLTPSYGRYIDLIVESEKTPEPKRKAFYEGTHFENVVVAIKRRAAQWGFEALKGDTDGTSAENETSVVQYAEMCGKKILLTGDTGVQGLEEAYNFAVHSGVVLPGVDLFDVPHHGSRRNLSSDILDKWLGQKHLFPPTNSSYTAIMSANRNDADHPRPSVVRALKHRGGKVYQPKGVLHQPYNAPDRGWTAADELDYPTEVED